jgi:hypothetical protein
MGRQSIGQKGKKILQFFFLDDPKDPDVLAKFYEKHCSSEVISEVKKFIHFSK